MERPAARERTDPDHVVAARAVGSASASDQTADKAWCDPKGRSRAALSRDARRRAGLSRAPLRVAAKLQRPFTGWTLGGQSMFSRVAGSKVFTFVPSPTKVQSWKAK